MVDVGETDPNTKTLFVRPNQWDADLTSAPYTNYWPKFLQLFPSTRAGFAEIPALTAEGIEVVVIGDPRHLDPGGYAAWGNFEHNPATDGTRPYCDIMEIVYYDNRDVTGFYYCNDYGDCENNNGHNYFYNGLATADAPHWLFDVMGYAPGSPINMHGYTHHYRTPRVYQRVLDNYFAEGAYAQIAAPSPAQYPETTTCDNAHCQPDGSMDVSPFNLADSESGSSFSQPPDGTVEFNDITFYTDGSVEAVGANDKERYDKDEVWPARWSMRWATVWVWWVIAPTRCASCTTVCCIGSFWGMRDKPFMVLAARGHRPRRPGRLVHLRLNAITVRAEVITLEPIMLRQPALGFSM